jgi:hypothetical protein
VLGRRGQLASAVAAAVDTVAGVRRTGGGGVEVATQYPGGRVVGVLLGAETVTVQVIAEQFPLIALADSVRAAVRVALSGFDDQRRVDVTIDDIDVAKLPSRELR